jgi:hypothetical protein
MERATAATAKEKEPMVTRLLERLARWQLALISMAVGAGLFAGGMWIFNRAHEPVRTTWDPEIDREMDRYITKPVRKQAIEGCRLESMRYGKDQNPADQRMYVEQCMRVAGFRPAFGEGLELKCGTDGLIEDSECYEWIGRSR